MHQEIRETANQQEQSPDKAAYLDRIMKLPAEDRAFMEGYLYARVTAAAKPA